MKFALVLLGLAGGAQATCSGAQCNNAMDNEGDAGALLQIHTANRQTDESGDTTATTTPFDTEGNSTRPSDREAVLALWNANGSPGQLKGWGKGDPCIGPPDPGQGNAQGFGPWKGVACVPCTKDNPTGKEYCVSEIWNHQKNLTGTIPETFRDLNDLKWLFLSANNMTGPMPQNNWFTFPNLRYLDITYNTINGVLPLDRLSSIPALQTILAHDNHFDSVCYNGGGFPELTTLDMKYNRNMSGVFPSEPLSKLPKLRFLAIHDTNLTGPVFNGPYPSMENLIISGSGDLCGPHPDVCDRDGVFCDIPPIYPFPDCEEKKQKLIFGTPLAGYHNATMHVYAEAMRELGYEVDVISQYIHPILYPMFTGFGGTAAQPPDAGCKENGCADKCAESGLGNKSPCIDFAVDSNIPVNHATWLKAYTDTFDVIGTAFETQYITLWAPKYTGWKTINCAAKALEKGNADDTIIGFKGGLENDCATLYCPKCGNGDLPYISGPPLSTAGYGYKSLYCPDFEKKVARKLKKKKNFVVLMWTPQVFSARFPELVPLDILNYTYLIKPNQGKAQVRKAARHKFSDKALSVLGAIFIGTEDVKMMDGWSHGVNNEPAGQLCHYESWNNNCALEAAQKWIRQNKDHGKTQGVWKTFFW